MSVVRKIKQSFFPRMPEGRRRQERKNLLLGLGLGLIAAMLSAAIIYLLQDRFGH